MIYCQICHENNSYINWWVSCKICEIPSKIFSIYIYIFKTNVKYLKTFMMFANTVKYCKIREILSRQYFLNFTVYHNGIMIHNIVHFIVLVHQQFAAHGHGACGPARLLLSRRGSAVPWYPGPGRRGCCRAAERRPPADRGPAPGPGWAWPDRGRGPGQDGWAVSQAAFRQCTDTWLTVCHGESLSSFQVRCQTSTNRSLIIPNYSFIFYYFNFSWLFL